LVAEWAERPMPAGRRDGNGLGADASS